ncbi:MAG: Hsp33 family molecular chaperone HslO, partial [Lachnospiraceae bacterium]|nr:Hsp33 family molecular chaperone HslO [Lachnospiraceae bacterium]
MGKDYMLRAMSRDGHLRAFAVNSKNLVADAYKAHNTTPVVTAALGRLLSAGVMMGAMCKGDADILTISLKGDGPVGSVTVTADSKGRVKGFAANPNVELPLKSNGKLDVGGAVGRGTLTVIKDLGLKDPYIGQTELVNGEVAEDLTYYFAASEQVPSSVGLGVLVNPDGTVRQAGGFIVQVMPDAPDELIDVLEKNIGALKPVTTSLESGESIEDILADVFANIEYDITSNSDISFYCNCSRD